MASVKSGPVATAEEIHANVLEAAEEEMDRPISELALAGLAAGLTISFSYLSVVFVTSRMSPENHALAGGLAYPVGFVLVVMASHQLFTENTLEPVIPALERRNARAFRKLLRLWAIVLPANLLGTFVFAFVLSHTRTMDPALSGTMLDVAREGTKGGAALVFLRAIWAGWLVALMAWLLAATKETIAQIALIWLTVGPIAAFGFKHSIAGATEGFYRVLLGDMPFSEMFLSFELPALLGNVLGGVVLVALLNHGQVPRGGSGGGGDKKKK